MNLHDLTAAAIESSETLDYTEIADDVLAHIDPAEYPDALREALRVYARHVIVSSRKAGPVEVPKDDAPTLPASSWKTAATRACDWQERLNEVYGTRDGGRKRLRDFTPDDLDYLADHEEKQAKRLFARASGWRALAATARAAGATVVGDLPATVLESAVA